MKTKLLLITLLFATMPAVNAQNRERDYLKKVFANLEKIESATYYVANESWQPGDSTALSILHGFIKEYNHPIDSTIGASYVSLDAKDTTKLNFCYDGNVRVEAYHDNKKLVIDDFTFKPLPFRLVRPPFFNFAKNIIKYALTTDDNITIELKDEGNDYYFKLTINEEQQVEFLEKPSTCLFPHSISAIRLLFMNYGLINRIIYLLRSRREMSHDISVSMFVPTFQINKLNIRDFNINDYFPKDYETVKYSDLHKKSGDSPSTSGLTGQKAPGWILENIDGQSLSLANCKSKVILINFTGIGCGACQAAVPFLKKLKELFSNEEFDLIAIESWSHNASAIRNYAKRKDLNYTILNATNKVIKQYQTGGAAPFFFILDQKRIIRKIIRGYSTENTDKEIINAIKELL